MLGCNGAVLYVYDYVRKAMPYGISKQIQQTKDAFIFQKRSGRAVGNRADDAGCAAGDRKDWVLPAAPGL